MKAIGKIELGVSLEKDKPVVLSHTVLDPSVLEYRDRDAEEARKAQNKAKIVDFYRLDPDTVAELEYETGILKREVFGVEVPEKRALLTHTDVKFTDGTEKSFTMLVDSQTRVPEPLAAGLGFEADRDEAHGDFWLDKVTTESDAYYGAARKETEMYMAAWMARETGAMALLVPEEAQQGADVIQLRPFMDETAFGAQEAVS